MSRLKSLNTKQITTCDVVNPVLGQAKQYDGVKPINVILNLLL